MHEQEIWASSPSLHLLLRIVALLLKSTPIPFSIYLCFDEGLSTVEKKVQLLHILFLVSRTIIRHIFQQFVRLFDSIHISVWQSKKQNYKMQWSLTNVQEISIKSFPVYIRYHNTYTVPSKNQNSITNSKTLPSSSSKRRRTWQTKSNKTSSTLNSQQIVNHCTNHEIYT